MKFSDYTPDSPTGQALRRLAGGRLFPAADLVLNVNKNGSDAEGADGLSNPFLTINALLRHVAVNYDLSLRSRLTVQVGGGTYREALNLPQVPGAQFNGNANGMAWPQLQLIGNPGNPSNVVLAPPAGTAQGAVQLEAGSPWFVSGLQVDMTQVADYNAAFQSNFGGQLFVGDARVVAGSGNYHFVCSADMAGQLFTREQSALLIDLGSYTGNMFACASNSFMQIAGDVVIPHRLNLNGWSFLYVWAALLKWEASFSQAASLANVSGQSYYLDDFAQLHTGGTYAVPGDLPGYVSPTGRMA